MAGYIGVLGGADDHEDIMSVVKAKQETSTKKRLDPLQLKACRNLKYSDKSLREYFICFD